MNPTLPASAEGSPEWMELVRDRICPLCFSGIAGVVQLPCRCASAIPCGHHLLKGDRAADGIKAIWAAVEGAP